LIVRYICLSIPFFDPLTLARNTLPAFPEQLFGPEISRALRVRLSLTTGKLTRLGLQRTEPPNRWTCSSQANPSQFDTAAVKSQCTSQIVKLSKIVLGMPCTDATLTTRQVLASLLYQDRLRERLITSPGRRATMGLGR
jgi:hypothetical protein